MHGEYIYWRRLMVIAIAVTILAGAVSNLIEKGAAMAIGFVLASLVTITLVSVLSVVLAGWVGYFAGFHKEERLSGWRLALAFFLMPVAWFAVPVVLALPTKLLTPLVPSPMAEEFPSEHDV